jgi:hypothetical protein
MKRASYRDAIKWIASNDDIQPSKYSELVFGETAHVEEIAGLISVVLIADIFAIDSKEVAFDVVKSYRKQQKETT